MPHRVALVTDSTCDIPAEWIRQYEIIVVPLTIIIGGQQYLDGVDLTPVEFYRRLAAERIYQTTSQPAPEVFARAFRQAAERGAHEVLAMTISGAMSGTIE